MAKFDFKLNGRRYVLSSDENEDHLRAVCSLVSKKLSGIQEERPHISAQNAALLAAFDFASLWVKGRKNSMAYRTTVLAQAQSLLRKMQDELTESNQES